MSGPPGTASALAGWLRKQHREIGHDERRGAPRMALGAEGFVTPVTSEGTVVARRRRVVTLVDISKSGARCVSEAALPPGIVELNVPGPKPLVVRGELLACDRHERQRSLFVLRIRFVGKSDSAD